MSFNIRDFKDICREEIDGLSVKSFTGHYSGLISYLKTLLETKYQGKKSIIGIVQVII